MLTPDRMADVRRVLSPDAPINEDFNPILYFYHLRYWISQFAVRFGLLEGGLIVAVDSLPGAIEARCRWRYLRADSPPRPWRWFYCWDSRFFTDAFIIKSGLIITMFMLGLGIGSFAMNRLLPRCGRNHLVALALAMAIYSACVPYILMALGQIEIEGRRWVSWAAIPLMTLLLAMIVGMEFPLAGKVGFQEITATAARLYTADYIGAALGALLVSTLLIPVHGRNRGVSHGRGLEFIRRGNDDYI